MFSRRAVVILGVCALSALMVVPLLWPKSGPASASAVGQVRAPARVTPAPPRPIGVEVPPVGRYTEPQYPAAPPGPAAPSLVGGPLAPGISTGFAGLKAIGSDISSPPDTHAAAGPDSIVEMTNGHVAIYNKTGGIIAGGDSGAGEATLQSFCPSPVNTTCFDPNLLYDQVSGRFVAVAGEYADPYPPTAAGSYLDVMVSKDSTPTNLTTDWDKFRASTDTNFSGTHGWFDYPTLGVSPDAVVVAGNMFSNTNAFLGVKVRVYDKTELYDQDLTATYLDLNLTGAGGTMQPAHHFGVTPAGTFYLFSRYNSTNLLVTALTGVPSGPIVLSSSFVTVTGQGGNCATLQVPQKGTTKKLDPVCFRMMNAVWRDGSLWGSATGDDAGETRTIVQWFEVHTNDFPTSAPTLYQHGTIDGGIVSGNSEFTFMPSIAVDNCGNAAITYTQSSGGSGGRYPEMRYTGRLSTDMLNSMQSVATAKTSAGFQDDYAGEPPDPERWGDYSTTALDPTDQSFWVTNEYVATAASSSPGNDSVWGTWIAKFTFGCTVGVGTPTPTPTIYPTRTPTATPCSPPCTPTPTPTKLLFPGDSDGDGCPDTKEKQTAIGSQTSGGLRDPHNPWDYFNPTHDHQNRIDDVLVVAAHYGKDEGQPGYSPVYDRTSLGPNLWNLGPPNGQIRIDDILDSVRQYNHDCS